MTPAARLHEMYRLLNECGEETDCGCGCDGDEPEDEPGEKKKGKKKLEDVDVADRVMAALDEARRKIGVRQFRRIKVVGDVKSAKGKKVATVRKMKQSIRRGAVHNRHR